MLPDKSFFKLFSNCTLAKGAKRSMIYDLQRRKIEFITNAMYDILTEYKASTIGEIKAVFGKENESTIESYFQFLLKGEFVFLCEEFELELFPELDLTYDVPNQIENALIDVDANSKHDFAGIFKQLEGLGCVALQVRFFFPEKMENITKMLDCLEGSSIETLAITSGFNDEWTIHNLNHLADTYFRLGKLIVHSTPGQSFIDFKHDFFRVLFTEKVVDSSDHCGVVNPEYFSVNYFSYIESQEHNSCLNHKLSIDTNGQIKNCPSLKDSFGHVGDTSLETALNTDGFKKYWTIHKDQIEICKDCEFRHICSDCRAFIKDPENIYSKPLKCGYNPYTNEWQDWSKNPLKEVQEKTVS